MQAKLVAVAATQCWQAAVLLSGTRLLGGSLGIECSEVEEVVVRSLSRLCCKWPKGSSVSSSIHWFSSSHISWSSAKGSCRSSFAISVSSVSPGSLCACNASRLASARTRFAWIVATCSSDSLCVCKAEARCLPRRVPARFCHPAHPSAPRERSKTSAHMYSRLCSSVFRHFATWLR